MQTPIGLTTIVADPGVAAPTVLRREEFTSRYRGAIYNHLDLDTLREQVGEFESLDLSHGQIDELVATQVPDGLALREEVVARKEQAFSDLHATLRSTGSSEDRRHG